jgi:hypothetical protein
MWWRSFSLPETYKGGNSSSPETTEREKLFKHIFQSAYAMMVDMGGYSPGDDEEDKQANIGIVKFRDINFLPFFMTLL